MCDARPAAEAQATQNSTITSALNERRLAYDHVVYSVSGRAVIAPNATARLSRLGRAREAVSDVVIVTALVWVPVLLLGGLAALVRLIF